MLINECPTVNESMQPVLLTQKESTKTGHLDSIRNNQCFPNIIFVNFLIFRPIHFQGTAAARYDVRPRSRAGALPGSNDSSR